MASNQTKVLNKITKYNYNTSIHTHTKKTILNPKLHNI